MVKRSITKKQKKENIITKRKNKTQNHRPKNYIPNNQNKSHIVKIFIELLNMVKLYHWKTRSYSKHKATDELYENLNKHIDEFVEIMLGKDQSRIQMMEKRIDLLDALNITEFTKRIHEYREFLIDLNLYFGQGAFTPPTTNFKGDRRSPEKFDARSDTDLLNSRDEILGDINQFLYLMSFDK